MTAVMKTEIKIVMSLSGQFWTLLKLKADPFIFHVTSKRFGTYDANTHVSLPPTGDDEQDDVYAI